MSGKKHTTRKQRQENNGKIEQTQRFENNAQGITEFLESTKDSTKPIINAAKEVGTVSSENGLMLGQASNTMAKYQKQYLDFVKSIIEPRLRKFAEGSKIQISYKNDEIANKQIRFYRQDDKLKENALILKDNNLHEGIHYICGEVSIVENHNGQRIGRNNIQTKNNDERQLLRFVIQEFFNDYDSLTSEESDSLQNNIYTVDEVIERLHGFNQRKKLLDFKRQGMSDDCISGINANIQANNSNHQNNNNTKAAAVISSSVATLANNFTTAISYNNSTVANIDLTTSTPEREDNTNLGVMIGSVVGAFLVGVGAAVLCYRKCYRIGTYRTGEPKTEDISSYVKNEEVDEEALLDQSNNDTNEQNQRQTSASSSCTSIAETKSIIKEEKKPLLSDQGKLDASDNKVKILNDKMVDVQQALKGKCQFSSCKAAEP